MTSAEQRRAESDLRQAVREELAAMLDAVGAAPPWALRVVAPSLHQLRRVLVGRLAQHPAPPHAPVRGQTGEER